MAACWLSSLPCSTATPILAANQLSATSYIPNSIYCNVGRCLTGEAVYHEAEMLCDIAGGVAATFPHEKDFLNPETRDFLLKYTKRSPDMPVEDKAQLWRYLGDVPCSASGGIHNIGSYHGGGPHIMAQIAT